MDLKASNVLLTKTNSIAKIGDVDGAQVMGSTTLQRPRAATFAYSAPELILNGACTEKVSLAFHISGFSTSSLSSTEASTCLSTLVQRVHWMLCNLCVIAAIQGEVFCRSTCTALA